jgi:hypothetical protein
MIQHARHERNMKMNKANARACIQKAANEPALAEAEEGVAYYLTSDEARALVQKITEVQAKCPKHNITLAFDSGGHIDLSYVMAHYDGELDGPLPGSPRAA